MNRTGSSGDAPEGWSLDDMKRNLALRRLLANKGGLFGGGWTRFKAEQQNAAPQSGPVGFIPHIPRKPLDLPPWITPTVPIPRASSLPFDLPMLNRIAASASQRSGSRYDPAKVGLPGDQPSVQGGTVGAAQQRLAGRNQDRAALGTGSVKRAISAPSRSPQIDPSRTDVFERGPDGKLHPILGWRTTGPFDFDAWSDNIDWRGVGRDLAEIAVGSAGFGKGVTAVAPGLIKTLGPKLGFKVAKGAVHGHHPDAIFMGGRPEQELYDLIGKFHARFHGRLRSLFKEAGGFPPVGGPGGSRKVWAEFLKANPGERGRAIEILRRLSREFDTEHGTSILPALEKELKIVNPTPRNVPIRK